MSIGMGPVKALFSRRRNCNCVSCVISEGIVPASSFPARFNKVSRSKFPMF